MRRARGRAIASRLFAVLVLAAACGLVGLLVGREQRIGTAQAATVQSNANAAAFHAAAARAYSGAFTSGYHEGWGRGSALARARASRAGRAVARARATERAADRSFVAAARSALALALDPVSAAAGRHTLRCVEVGGGLCEVPGPALTHRACPAGSAPDPATATVCVPEVLIEVEQQASQAAGAAAGQ